MFVYGTLLRGERNHRLLERAIFVREARTEASFQLLDLGAFPAMIAGGTTAVLGELYLVDDETLTRLDRLEGHPHLYARTEVMLEDGAQVQAYLLVDGRASWGCRIASGSWRARQAGRSAP